MKLRSMIGFCALAIAAFGLESNVCGLMNVPSTEKTTMIAVPWVTVGGTADTMKIANLVKADTLTAGDELYYYDGTTYYCWKLQDGVWTPTTTASQAGTFTAPGADYAIARGKGLFLVRQDATKEIWLYGQNSTDAVSVTVTANAYNMIANPNTSDYDLNTKGVTGAAGDQIILADGKIYNWNGTKAKWTKTVTKTVGDKTVKSTSTEGVTIPAGQGAWYASKGGAPTIAW